MIYKTLILTIAFIYSTGLFSQNNTDTLHTAKPGKGIGIVFIPTQKPEAYGLCLGLIGSEVLCDVSYPRVSSGVNIQLFGQGTFVLMNKVFGYKYAFQEDTSFMVKSNSFSQIKAKHNGILLSTFGTMTSHVNGISISMISSLGFTLNGISLNLIANKYTYLNGISVGIINNAYRVKGLQIGLINKSNTVKGLQIGLWNINKKRKLPFFNW